MLIQDGERIALRRRPDQGLLAGLYEFPNLPGHLNRRETLEWVEAVSYTHLDVYKRQYSDLTALMNAVYARTGGRSFLYNVRNLTGADGDRQTAAFKAAVSGTDRRLFQVEWEAIQGHEMEGILIGGNLRCFLKPVSYTHLSAVIRRM